MIHPQYIIALIDVDIIQFKMYYKYNKYNFECDVYLNDIQTLYKIKQRFNSGKIININGILCLKITKQLEKLILFCRKNKILNKYKHVHFQRWAYLYQKLIIEKDIIKNIKETRKINRRLEYFKF